MGVDSILFGGGGSTPNTGSYEWVIPESIYSNSPFGGDEEIYILDKAANVMKPVTPLLSLTNGRDHFLNYTVL
jgi:hypothetical protein